MTGQTCILIDGPASRDRLRALAGVLPRGARVLVLLPPEDDESKRAGGVTTVAVGIANPNRPGRSCPMETAGRPLAPAPALQPDCESMVRCEIPHAE